MPKILAVHVVLPRGLDIVQLAPGDEVPDWALDLVGDHCLILPPDDADGEEDNGETPNADPNDESDDSEKDDASANMANEGSPDTTQAVPEAPEVPDFTAPAKPKTRRTKAQ